jgi:hypothetical protein
VLAQSVLAVELPKASSGKGKRWGWGAGGASPLFGARRAAGAGAAPAPSSARLPQRRCPDLDWSNFKLPSRAGGGSSLAIAGRSGRRRSQRQRWS